MSQVLFLTPGPILVEWYLVQDVNKCKTPYLFPQQPWKGIAGDRERELAPVLLCLKGAGLQRWGEKMSV